MSQEAKLFRNNNLIPKNLVVKLVDMNDFYHIRLTSYCRLIAFPSQSIFETQERCLVFLL